MSTMSPDADPFIDFDLQAEVEALKAAATWATGRSARTLIKHDHLRIVLIALAADARMQEHKAVGRISIHVLSGHVEIRCAGRTFGLHAGGLLSLDPGLVHDVHALEDSAFLITMAGHLAP